LDFTKSDKKVLTSNFATPTGAGPQYPSIQEEIFPRFYSDKSPRILDSPLKNSYIKDDLRLTKQSNGWLPATADVRRWKEMKRNLGTVAKQIVIAFLSSVLILVGLFCIYYGVHIPKHYSPLEWWGLLLPWVLFGALLIFGGIKLLTAIKNP
jgi:hypothetical protein